MTEIRDGAAAESSAAAATTSESAATELAPPTARLGATLFNVAWMSILLGLVLEALLLILAAAFKNAQSAGPVIADLVQKVSWSSLVCVGLGVGTAAAKVRPVVMGLLGLLSAPLAFGAARTLHKSAQQALSISGAAGGGPSPWTLALIKAAEYAFFGLIIGWIARKHWGGLRAHLGVGFATGLIFGGAIVGLMARSAATPLSTYALCSRGINELIFPMGCAVVLFAAQALAQRK